jgi:hypothetical protein
MPTMPNVVQDVYKLRKQSVSMLVNCPNDEVFVPGIFNNT